jgi:hypothetical protein
MGEEEVRDGALKNDNANGIALRGQPARELVELTEHGGIHQVNRTVVDRHPRDSMLDANVQGVKIRKAHENCFPRGVYVSGHPNAPIRLGRRCIFAMAATLGSPSAGFHGSRVDSRYLAK